MKIKYFYSFFICLVYLSVFFISPVNAGSKKIITGVDIYSGWYTDTKNQGFEYLGVGLDHKIDDQRVLTAKIIADYLNYEYESGTEIIKAKVPELKLFIGETRLYRSAYLTVIGGIVKRNTSFHPDDKSNSTRGPKTGLILETDYTRDLSERLIINLLGDYNTIGHSLWGRGKLKYLVPSNKITNKYFIGMEGIGEGNSDYSAYRLGPIFEIQKLKENLSILFGLGYRHSNSISSSGYFSIDLYHRF
ncbi:MAG: cellulose biosynthesis protein BcsS [bacterium]|nr:cellulose biosynthesis protein BcsS [bacterium]